jgi:glutamyl-tRNA reductase
LFRAALQTGKQARTDTAIGRDVVSLGAAAVELASRHCSIAQSRCAVIGAGQMGTAVAKHLRTRGARSLTIVNRSQRRAATLARQVEASTAALEALPSVLANHDLVITAIGRGSFILDESTMREALASRQDPALLIVDIGVPRDVEPSAALLPHVVVYSIEDLREVVDRTLEGRRSEIPRVEAIVATHVASYLDWYRTRGAAPLIASLRRKAEEIRAAEIERLFARMPELGDAQRQMVVAASVTIINRLLHAPVTKLRKTMAEGTPQAETHLAEVLDADAFSDRLLRQLDSQLFSR